MKNRSIALVNNAKFSVLCGMGKDETVEHVILEYESMTMIK